MVTAVLIIPVVQTCPCLCSAGHTDCIGIFTVVYYY